VTDLLPAINNRLYAQPFIVAPSDEVHFRDLVDRIRKRGYEGALPAANEMGAWPRCWDLLQKLLEQPPKQQVTFAPDTPPIENLRITAQQVRDMRTYLSGILHQHGYGASILGLEADDLTTVSVDADGLVKLAGRLEPIYARLRQLTNDQIRVFFLECRVLLLEHRLADLEQSAE
jgi:hypothetical protein